VWDPYFLASAATALFWYHHWDEPEIHEALYEDHVLPDEEFTRLQTEVQRYEAEGLPRDPEYLPEGIAPEDAYADEYIRSVYAEEEESGAGLIFLASVLGGLVLCFALFRRRG
jgi:hypothetical protein